MNNSIAKVNIPEIEELITKLKSVSTTVENNIKEYEKNLKTIESAGYLVGVAEISINLSCNKISKTCTEFKEYATKLANSLSEVTEQTEQIESTEKNNIDEIMSFDPTKFAGIVGAGTLGVMGATGASSLKEILDPKTKYFDSITDNKSSNATDVLNDQIDKIVNDKPVAPITGTSSEKENAESVVTQDATNSSSTEGNKKEPETSTVTTTTTTTIIDPTLAKNLDARLGSGFSAKVEEVSKNINCNPNDLLALMYSESGINPSATNKSSGSTGLIQFMPSTAKNLGYTTTQLKNMTAIEQLDVVEKCITSSDYYMKGQAKDAGDLYSLCFLPGRSNREVLTSSGENYYKWNSALDINKDGQITKTDLSNRLDKKYAEMESSYGGN